MGEVFARAVKKLVLFYEYIPGYSLSKIIKKKKDTVSVKTIIASIKIIMTSLYCAFKQVGFTHYDLHTSNILMKKCDPDLVFVIHDGSGNAFALPTFGYIPSIIDFGFSYIDTIDNGPMYQSLAHTNVGFVSCAMDKFADTKLFLMLSKQPDDETSKNEGSHEVTQICEINFQGTGRGF